MSSGGGNGMGGGYGMGGKYGQGGGGNGGSYASCGQIKVFIDLVLNNAPSAWAQLDDATQDQIRDFSKDHPGLFERGAQLEDSFFGGTKGGQATWWNEVWHDISNLGTNDTAFKADDPNDPYTC